jgi:hypothetical protein
VEAERVRTYQYTFGNMDLVKKSTKFNKYVEHALRGFSNMLVLHTFHDREKLNGNPILKFLTSQITGNFD